MLVIPAVDIRGGRCVRLFQGDFARETEYSGDPVGMAAHWRALGARALHVIDLDGARAGRPRNLEAVRWIVERTGLPVQFGGGLRDGDAVEAAFAAGVSRVILGTVACGCPELVESLLGRYGDRVVISVDCDQGTVMTHGWQQPSGETAGSLVTRLMQLGARSFIYTDTRRDGTLHGPDLEGITAVLKTGASLMAAGGVGTIGDIVRLRSLEARGLAGVIVGRAIYDGTLDFVTAMTAAETSCAGKDVYA